MRGGARVLPGVRCFRGAAAVLGGGAAAVFGVRGGCLRNLSAALSLRSVRRRVLCRALHRVLRAVIPRAGLCAGLLCRARARIINFSLI